MSPITDPSEEYFKDGAWGWDGTVWRKLPMLFGYSDDMSEEVIDLNAAAGSDILVTTAVPAGEVHVVQAISARDTNTDLDTIIFYVVINGLMVALKESDPPAANKWSYWTGELTLGPGDYIRAFFSTTVAADDIYLRIAGYKMLIAA